MWILKKINNNCAVGRDSSGQDVIVFGKGIGYKRPPYELTDLSRIDRTFYDVQSSSALALKDIPEDVVLLASDVIDYAREALDIDLNPNAPITLADHIAFAIRRAKEGIEIQTPLAFDVKHLYPKECRIGRRTCTLVKTRLGVELPEAEITNIALHIIDAEVEQSNMDVTITAAKVTKDVTAIIERMLVQPDAESFAYARFVMHLRFLVGRLKSGTEMDSEMDSMLDTLRGSYPDSYACVLEILAYLTGEWGWTCDESEILYLLIHVQRLKTSSEKS